MTFGDALERMKAGYTATDIDLFADDWQVVK